VQTGAAAKGETITWSKSSGLLGKKKGKRGSVKRSMAATGRGGERKTKVKKGRFDKSKLTVNRGLIHVELLSQRGTGIPPRSY